MDGHERELKGMKVLAIAERTREQLKAVVRDQLVQFSLSDLRQIADQWIESPETMLAIHSVMKPKDTGALIASVYYEEMFRRIEQGAQLVIDEGK